MTLVSSSQGTGKQLRGAVVNLASYYFAAVPVAILLAFPGSQGVAGLYAGLCIGPAIQVQHVPCTPAAAKAKRPHATRCV